MEDKEFSDGYDDPDLSPDHPALQHIQQVFIERYRKRSEELEQFLRYEH
jgi:hypothetical protein